MRALQFLSDGRKKTTHFNGWMNCVKSLSAPRARGFK